MHQCKDLLRSRQPLEVVLADIGQARAWWELVGHQFGCSLGEQDVTAVGQRPQPGCPVQRLAVVVAVPQFRLPAVQRDSGGKCEVVGPYLSGHRLLERQRCRDRIGGSDERGEGGVALTAGLDELAAVGSHRPGDERLMSSQCRAHGCRVGLPQWGRAFDIGQQEGHDPFRQLPRVGWRSPEPHNVAPVCDPCCQPRLLPSDGPIFLRQEGSRK
jgi:hypothetical protein